MKPARTSLAALGAAALLALTQPASAQQLLPAQSELSFVVKQMGVPITGHFKKFDAQVRFDPAKLAQANVTLTVDMGSATLGSKELDAELPSPTWFNTAQFAQARFSSTAIKALGGGRFEVAGQISLKGRTQPLTVPLTMTQAGPITTASGVVALKRLSFKIGDGEWADTSMVADEVSVRFKLALSGVAKL